MSDLLKRKFALIFWIGLVFGVFGAMVCATNQNPLYPQDFSTQANPAQIDYTTVNMVDTTLDTVDTASSPEEVSTQALPAGLLFYESFDSNASIAANNGTIHEPNVNKLLVYGIKGNALNFNCSFVYDPDSSLPYCSHGTYVEYLLKNRFNYKEGTITFWVNPLENYNLNGGGFFDIGRLWGTHPNSMGIFYNVDHAITEIRTNTTAMIQAWSSGAYSGAYPWYFISVTWKNGKMTTFLNGVPGSERSYSSFYPNMSGTFYVGNNAWYGVSSAFMDEFKIYNYSKSSTNIMNEYNTMINNALPKVASYSPTQSVIIASLGSKKSFSINFSNPRGNNLIIKWFVDGVNVKQEMKYGSSLNVTLNHIGATRVEAIATNGVLQAGKFWDILVVSSKKNFTKTGSVILNNSAYEWTFSIPTSDVGSAKYAIVTIDYSDGPYSSGIWKSPNKNGAVVYVNGQHLYNGIYIKRIRNEFYCNGKYYGGRCNQTSMRFAIPVGLLTTSTKIKINASNSVWKITKVTLTLDPNDNVILAGGKFYIDGKPLLMEGMAYAPTLQGTGPDPNVHDPLPSEYDDVTSKVDGKYVPDYNHNGKREMWEVIEYDMYVMKNAGVNNIRTYSAGYWHDQDLDNKIDLVGNCNISEIVQGDLQYWVYDRMMDYALQNDMYVTMGYWVQEEDYRPYYQAYCTYYANWTDLLVAQKTMKRMIDYYGYEPSLATWGIGNEVNLYQNQDWFEWMVDENDYLNALCNYTKIADKNRRPIMYAKYIGEKAYFKELSCYDIIAPNAYIFSANSSELLNEFATPAPSGKAYMLGEYGHNLADAKGQWALAKNYAGGFFLEYNDVWWKGPGYQFGIVNSDRKTNSTRFYTVKYLYAT